MNDLLFFRKMLTPTIIQVAYWFGLAALLLLGIKQLTHGVYGLIAAVVTLILGPLALRVTCELILVLFSIHERLAAATPSVRAAGADGKVEIGKRE